LEFLTLKHRLIRFPFKYSLSLFLKYLLVSFFLLTCIPYSHSGENKTIDNPKKHPWALTLYGGAHWQDRLRDIFLFRATFPDEMYITAIALGKELWKYEDWIGLEAEGQIAKHFGNMDHWEFNALLILRWHPFPWDKYIDTSFAVGDGISYATEIPLIEKDPEAGRTMNYLLYELTFGLPDVPEWAFVIRVHHRSSIFGVIDNDYGASNFLCAGIKYYF